LTEQSFDEAMPARMVAEDRRDTNRSERGGALAGRVVVAVNWTATQTFVGRLRCRWTAKAASLRDIGDRPQPLRPFGVDGMGRNALPVATVQEERREIAVLEIKAADVVQ
jgi:hypothetical protein